MELSINLDNGDEIRLKPILQNQDLTLGEEYYNLVPTDGGEDFIKLQLKNNRLNVIWMNPQVKEEEDILRSKLDDLLIELIEAQQLGTENSESPDSLEVDFRPYDPDKIRVDTKTFSLRQIAEMITEGDIDLSPDFQRHFVWDGYRKSLLIESILLRIPLPMFYFSQDEDGRITVVDGLQRLSTINSFMNNEFRLKNLEYLEACNNKYYNKEKRPSIDAKYFRWFNMTQITVNVIDPSSPADVKYDIFRRINTGGKPLNSQEIRNCLAVKNLRDILRKMINLDSFKEATGGSVKDVRMEAQELALRFICFLRLYEKDKTLNNYNGKIETVLDLLVDELNKLKKEDLEIYVDLFDIAMKNASFLFGRYAFRKCKLEHLKPNANRQLINKALFVSWSVLLSKYNHSLIIQKNAPESLTLPLAQEITEDYEFFLYLTYSTNSKANMQAAFKQASGIILNNLIT